MLRRRYILKKKNSVGNAILGVRKMLTKQSMILSVPYIVKTQSNEI